MKFSPCPESYVSWKFKQHLSNVRKMLLEDVQLRVLMNIHLLFGNKNISAETLKQIVPLIRN